MHGEYTDYLSAQSAHWDAPESVIFTVNGSPEGRNHLLSSAPSLFWSVSLTWAAS